MLTGVYLWFHTLVPDYRLFIIVFCLQCIHEDIEENGFILQMGIKTSNIKTLVEALRSHLYRLYPERLRFTLFSLSIPPVIFSE